MIMQDLPGETGPPVDREPLAKWSATPAAPIPPKRVAAGWIALFDGHSLYGWRAESTANWHVADECLCAETGQPGLLRTTSQFDDFQLHVEFAAPESTNSGLLLRTSPRPRGPAGDGYEINIASDDPQFPTASLVQRQRSGGETARQAADGLFHQLEVTAQAGRIVVRLDGQPVTDYTDPRPLGRGYIGLQYETGSVRFRNIWLRPLGTRPLFDQGDPAAWRVGGAARVSFHRHGVLRIQGGPGCLETRDQWGDFVLQAECRIAAGQNSGIFFRCISGDNMNGYESQIQNGFNKHRTRPTDAGTGAVFRRTTARLVAADDDHWFAKTIAACGPHISVWVNGYQVTDWTDQRLPDPNPRRGLRLDAGTIMLQAHDDQTDVWFRDVRIGELAVRR